MKLRWFIILLVLLIVSPVVLSVAQEEQGDSARVVLLGTGNPMPDPDRAGSATAIVVNGSAYLVDFGPGVVRRAAAAAAEKKIRELQPNNIQVVFSTHHTCQF